jgi:hypothetical protein
MLKKSIIVTLLTIVTAALTSLFPLRLAAIFHEQFASTEVKLSDSEARPWLIKTVTVLIRLKALPNFGFAQLQNATTNHQAIFAAAAMSMLSINKTPASMARALASAEAMGG